MKNNKKNKINSTNLFNFWALLSKKKKVPLVTKGILKPTISKEEDQFLSELVEKCCEFEPNKRIEFKSICNLIEGHSPNLVEQPNQNNNTNQNGSEYHITTAQQQADYNILLPQQQQADYNTLLPQKQADYNTSSIQQQKSNKPTSQQNHDEMEL